MQQRANEAYAAQWMLHRITRTLPSGAKQPVNVDLVEENSDNPECNDDGDTVLSSTGLYNYAESKGIGLPLCTRKHSCALGLHEGLQRAPARCKIVFLLDLDGSLISTRYANKVDDTILHSLASCVNMCYPEDPTFVELVQAAASYSPELKAALETDMANKFADASQTESVRNLLIAHITQATNDRSYMPHVKQIQSFVWLRHLQTGRETTHVFKDVNTFLRTVSSTYSDVARVAIYSSYAKDSQKALLRNTCYGDLTPFVSTFFDLSDAGLKLQPKSYSRVRRMLTERLHISSGEFSIVFITDSPSEVSAAEASSAVECSFLCVRPYNNWITSDTFIAVSVAHLTNFKQLLDRGTHINYSELVDDA